MRKKKKGRRYLFIVLFVGGILSFITQSGLAQTPAEPGFEYAKHQIDSLTSNRLQQSFTDLSPDVQYKICQAFFIKSFNPGNTEQEKKILLEKCLQLIGSLKPDSSSESLNELSLKAMLQQLGFLNLEERSLNTDILKRELENKIQNYPLNAEIYATYGELLLKYSEFSLFEQMLCRYFYTPLPQENLNEKALLHLLKAKTIEPTPYIYYFLAVAYFRLGNHRDAFLSIKSALSFKPKTPYIDAYYQALAKKLKQKHLPKTHE